MGQTTERVVTGSNLLSRFLHRGSAHEIVTAPVVSPLIETRQIVDGTLDNLRREVLMRGGVPSLQLDAAATVLSSVLAQVDAYDAAIQSQSVPEDGQAAFIGGVSPKTTQEPLLNIIAGHFAEHPIDGRKNGDYPNAQRFRESLVKNGSDLPWTYNDATIEYVLATMQENKRGEGNSVFLGGVRPNLETAYPWVRMTAADTASAAGHDDFFSWLKEEAWRGRLAELIAEGGSDGINMYGPDGRVYHLVQQGGLTVCNSHKVPLAEKGIQKLAFLTSKASLQQSGLIQ